RSRCISFSTKLRQQMPERHQNRWPATYPVTYAQSVMRKVGGPFGQQRLFFEKLIEVPFGTLDGGQVRLMTQILQEIERTERVSRSVNTSIGFAVFRRESR